MPVPPTMNISERVQAITREVERAIIGKSEVVRLAIAGLLAGGHVLVDDIPGVGKTTLAKAISKAIGGTFKRIQFTPDLLPADITGTSVFNQKTAEFEFRLGPIFANVVLADEINRAMPKTQSALLECMEEMQVTSDGVTRPTPQPFFVIATENSLEQRSTYPLPDAQLDRFLMRLSVGYPSPSDEAAMLRSQMKEHPISQVQQIMDAKELLSLQEQIKEVRIDESLEDYIVRIASATRGRPEVTLGVSPRGSLALMRCSRAWAAMEGRDYVLPDDIKHIASSVLAHRLVLNPEARVKGISDHSVVRQAIESVRVPIEYG